MNILYKTLKKKKTKKNMHKPDIINTRVRKTIKEIIREEYNNTIMKKEKYDTIKKYSSKTSKHSTQIIRTKMYTYENERKMMVRMIHNSLPICEKINRIVKKEKVADTIMISIQINMKNTQTMEYALVVIKK